MSLWAIQSSLSKPDGRPGTIRTRSSVFVDGRVSITPDDVNGVGEPHTFVVDADQDVGPAPASCRPPNGHADLTLTDANGAVNQLNAAASTCDDAGDNLDADGQCTIAFTSNTTGTVTGHATVTMNLTTSGPDHDRPSDQWSRWQHRRRGQGFVDGSLAWFKNDDTGARLSGATFEVCRHAHARHLDERPTRSSTMRTCV